MLNLDIYTQTKKSWRENLIDISTTISRTMAQGYRAQSNLMNIFPKSTGKTSCYDTSLMESRNLQSLHFCLSLFCCGLRWRQHISIWSLDNWSANTFCFSRWLSWGVEHHPEFHPEFVVLVLLWCPGSHYYLNLHSNWVNWCRVTLNTKRVFIMCNYPQIYFVMQCTCFFYIKVHCLYFL